MAGPAGRRVGLFGGTFDPVHVGHLALAECARRELELDHVLFVPAHIPPHKQTEGVVAPPDARLVMLELAIAGNPGFAVARHELQRRGVSYTVDTIAALRASRPEDEIVLLLGADNARDFRTWKEPGIIAANSTIAVWARAGAPLPEELLPGVGFRTIRAPLLEISSTEIRSRVRIGLSIRYLVPDAVDAYIEDHELYR